MAQPEQYPVKAVARLTGLTPETLRAWERRYRAVEPVRDEAGRRLYSAADVERLRRFKDLVDAGHSIGRVVGMSEAERERLARASATSPDRAEIRMLREGLLQPLRHYDAAELERRLGLAMAALEADALVTEVLSPVLESVGRDWERGAMDIAQERLMSSLVQARILATLHSAPELKPAMLLATPSGEQHELGLLMVAFRAASRLIPLRYLGPNLPLAEVQRLAQRFQPKVVALSLVGPAPEGFADELATLAGGGFEVWLGGRGSEALAFDPPPGSRLIRTEEEARRALDGLAA